MLITAIIEGDNRQACMVMGTTATDSAPVKVNDASICDSSSPEVRQMTYIVDRLRPSFTPKGSKGQPMVEVAQVPVTGGKAIVPANKITIGGQTLDEVMVSNSTGFEAGQVDVEFEASKSSDSWYVTDMKLDFG
jgi:hypothetical protein